MDNLIQGIVGAGPEHRQAARYAFAARLARGRRTLDIGRTIGCGCEQLAKSARHVTGLEVDPEAIDTAGGRLSGDRIRFTCGDTEHLPFRNCSFDLIVAFDVTEWGPFLFEARRVLSDEGLLIASTFNYPHLSAAVHERFPYVQRFLEKELEAVIFSLPEVAQVEIFTELGAEGSEAAGSYVIVASLRPQISSPALVYIPPPGNVLREREKHIRLLQGELEDTKETLTKWQEAHRNLEAEHVTLRSRAQEVVDQLEAENLRRTEWASELQTEVERLKDVVQSLQLELDDRTAWALKLDAERSDLEVKYAETNVESHRLRSALDTCTSQLTETAAQLELTEKELESRTQWALDSDAQVQRLTADLNAIFGSIAYRLGRRVGLAPTPASDPRHHCNRLKAP